VTGRPVPPPATDMAAARARFGLADGDRCVLVFGGSLGARSINDAAVAAFAGRAVTGCCTRRARATSRGSGSACRPAAATTCGEYIDGFGEAVLASELCVARAGGSIFEVAAHGRPAILVPYPHATADHQTANARWMADGGAAVVIARRGPHAGAPACGGRRSDGQTRPPRGDGPRVGGPGAAGRGSAESRRSCSPRRTRDRAAYRRVRSRRPGGSRR